MTPCPVPRCPQYKRPADLMCQPHWFEVPVAIRGEFWRTLVARRDKGGLMAILRHERAKRAAIAAAQASGEIPRTEFFI